MKNRLYNVSPPAPLRDELMSHPDFYIPNSTDGLKTAAYLDDCSRSERIELFRKAAEEGTQDLAEAYIKVKKRTGSDDDDEDAEDLFEDEDYDTSDFVTPDGGMVENDDDDDDDDDDGSEEE